MKWMIVILSCLLGLLLSSQFVQAQVYGWTDKNGNVRFADDFSQVPEKYKKSAVPVGPTKERLEEIRRRQAEYEAERDRQSTQKPREERQWKGSSEGQQTRGSTDMMEEMVRKFPGLSYQWTQDMSLWVGVPASFAYDPHSLTEMAIKIAYHYHQKKGHLVCVRFYYGDGKVIARECR